LASDSFSDTGLTLPANTVDSLYSAKLLRHVRVGVGRGKILIPTDAVAEYMAKGTVASTEPYPGAAAHATRR